MKTDLRLKLVAAQHTAKGMSGDQQCVKHVNALLGKDKTGKPAIVGFAVSDWCDGSTVESWYKGRLLS